MDRSGASSRHAKIMDETLKRVYDEALEDPVPDRFRMLLEEFRRQDQAKNDE